MLVMILNDRENLLEWKKATHSTLRIKYPQIAELIHLDPPISNEEMNQRTACLNQFTDRVTAGVPIEPIEPGIDAEVEEITAYNAKMKSWLTKLDLYSKSKNAGIGATSELINLIASNVLSNISAVAEYNRYFKTGNAPQIWILIERSFELTGNEGAYKKMTMARELSMISQLDDEDIRTYATRYTNSRDKAVSYGITVPTGADAVFAYLISLNKQYEDLKRSIRLREATLINLNLAMSISFDHKPVVEYQAMKAVEHQATKAVSKEVVHAKSADIKSRYKKSFNKKLTCSYCMKSGHTVEQCRRRKSEADKALHSIYSTESDEEYFDGP